MAGLGVAQARTSVTADVVETAQLAVVTANDQDRLVTDGHGEPVTRLRSRARQARDEPRAVEDALLVEFEDLR